MLAICGKIQTFLTSVCSSCPDSALSGGTAWNLDRIDDRTGLDQQYDLTGNAGACGCTDDSTKSCTDCAALCRGKCRREWRDCVRSPSSLYALYSAVNLDSGSYVVDTGVNIDHEEFQVRCL